MPGPTKAPAEWHRWAAAEEARLKAREVLDRAVKQFARAYEDYEARLRYAKKLKERARKKLQKEDK